MSLKRCRHNSEEPCNSCEKRYSGECTVKRILTDASVICAAYLEEEHSDVSIDFIRQ